jgi:signal transduction histidine kinase/CheY-like chemotaxis protein
MSAPIAQDDILVVDDTPANLQLLSHLLTQHGYKVRAVLSGAQALTAARAALPDLIMLDIRMPEMDGYQVCERLKADERTRDVPILFISALSESEDKVKGFQVGGVDYITKPFQSAEVVARLETHLTLRRLQQKLEAQNAQLQAHMAERERAEADLCYLNERMQILHEIDLAIVGAQSPAAIARSILGRLSHLVPCERVSVVEFQNDQTDVLAVEATHGLGLDVSGWADLLYTVASLRPYIQGVADIGELSGHSALQERLFAEGTRSYVIVPLMALGQVIGTLNVESCQPNVFASEHVNVMAEVTGLLAVAMHQAQLRASLEQRTTELEVQNAELDAFAHTVAHDLKNPLSVVSGYAQMLAEYGADLPPEQWHEMAEAAARGASKAVSIVNNLLLLASAHRMTVRPQPLDMAVIVREALERLVNLIQEYRPEIKLPDRWPQAVGHAPWVEEVWANYIGNAIKYGSLEGEPLRIELGAASTQPVPAGGGEPAGDLMRFWVRDYGVGLTLEQQARLFTPFERLGQADIGGHGLGLSIVRRIVEKLGGQVGVESDGVPGHGSVFSFTLPTTPESNG